MIDSTFSILASDRDYWVSSMTILTWNANWLMLIELYISAMMLTVLASPLKNKRPFR